MALLDQAPVPGPGQGHGFGHRICFAVRAPQVAEEDRGVHLDAGQDGEEASVQGIEGGSGVVGMERWPQEIASQYGPSPLWGTAWPEQDFPAPCGGPGAVTGPGRVLCHLFGRNLAPGRPGLAEDGLPEKTFSAPCG